jgi:hypothetical protein
MFFEPHLPIPRPSVLLAVVGGIVATILLSALLYLAPLLGFPFIDYPLLIGGIFTANPDVALWLGYWIFFIFGALIFPLLLAFLWPYFPGSPFGIAGPLTKGVLWGLILWIFSSVLSGIFGLLSRYPANVLQNPGFFMLNAGILATLGNLLGHIIYTIAMILITSMGRGIEPMDTLGWSGYMKAQAPELVRGLPGYPEKQITTEH